MSVQICRFQFSYVSLKVYWVQYGSLSTKTNKYYTRLTFWYCCCFVHKLAFPQLDFPFKISHETVKKLGGRRTESEGKRNTTLRMFYNSKSAKKRELGVSGMPSVKSRPPTPYTFTVDGNQPIPSSPPAEGQPDVIAKPLDEDSAGSTD